MMKTFGGETTWKENLIEYYDTLELFMDDLRQTGSGTFHTHFGLLKEPPPEYCFCKALFLADLYPEQFQAMSEATESLQQEIFGALELKPGQKVLDVGCGTGGSLLNLANRFPRASLHGVNLNAVQLKKAGNLLQEKSNVHLHRGDFNSYDFGDSFSLIYFIESAFHNPDKETLCRRIGELLESGGEVYIIEFFLTPRTQRLLRDTETESSLFHYLSVPGWEEKLASCGVELTQYHNTSNEIAEFLHYSMTPDEFREEVIRRRMNSQEYSPAKEKHITHIYEGYQRLGKMLRRGYMEYGILRARRA